MNAQFELERRRTMRICVRAKKLFPNWSSDMLWKWVHANFILNARDRVVAGRTFRVNSDGSVEAV